MKTLEVNSKFEAIELANYGTQHWYRHPFYSSLLMTDGCKAFIEEFKCFWLFDGELPRALTEVIKNNKEENDLFNILTIKACNGKVDIEIKHDTYENVFYKRHIAHSDLEDGIYKTYLIGTPIYDDVTDELIKVQYTWLLTSEY